MDCSLVIAKYSSVTFGEGGSSIGRVAVSKTVGWGFESLPPCQREDGGVAEWSIATVLKTVMV